MGWKGILGHGKLQDERGEDRPALLVFEPEDGKAATMCMRDWMRTAVTGSSEMARVIQLTFEMVWMLFVFPSFLDAMVTCSVADRCNLLT